MKNEKQTVKRKKLGELLVEAGLIDESTLGRALEIQKLERKKLGRILTGMGVMDDDEIAKALAKQLKIPLVHLEQVSIPMEIIALVSAELAGNYLVLPVKRTEKSLVVAMANPLDFYAIEDLRFATGMSIETAVASERDILRAIERHYPNKDLESDLASGPEIGGKVEIVQRIEKEEEDITDTKDLLDLTERPPVVRFVNAILSDAINLRATDVHIEAQKTSVIIRYRIDGIMRETMKTDKHVHTSLVSRIKIISNMDITTRRKPQDGKAQVRYGGKTYDLRVSTIPTSYGEKVAIRILNPDTAAQRIEDLGFSPKDLEGLQDAVSRQQGLILVTGPTGSGKSSTLYACLSRLNTVDVNIVTVEDPIEYDIQGINQVQINPKAGITFAEGLRSILRQDPDIVMVGEIRDSETASIAIQAAQTGHLVFSTLHTNDAPSAVIRLVDLGIEPYLIAASLVAVVGQRLVRGICPRCKIPAPLSAEILKRVSPSFGREAESTFWEGAGCEACQYTGYWGRLGLFELLIITPALREIISSKELSGKLKKTAEQEGYQPMSLDGIHKAIQGLTTIEEILRVAPPEAGEFLGTPIVTPPATEEILEKEVSLGERPASISSIRPQRILVVDDSQIIIKILRNILEAEGYLVMAAANGLEALSLAIQEKPDLILTDYLMPEMDGITLIKKLKSQLSTRYIPIIMLTAKSEMDSEVKGIEAGADDYLTKPVNPKRVLLRVHKYLNRASIEEP